MGRRDLGARSRGRKANAAGLAGAERRAAGFSRYWIAGKPQYDPADIRVPTLLIHAEWDADLPSDQARGYFAKLTNAPYKRYIEIGEGTHSVMMEKNRMQFFREIMNFLNERDPQGVN